MRRGGGGGGGGELFGHQFRQNFRKIDSPGGVAAVVS